MKWQLQEVPPAPIDGEMIIWRLQLPMVPKMDSMLEGLSGEERSRADQFRSDQARCRFVYSRLGLRYLLSHYLKMSADLIEFEKTVNGKPFVPDSTWQFNMSHSGDEILYVFGQGSDWLLGVDVERVRDCKDHLNIAERFFSRSEFEALEKLSFSRQQAAFFHIWTQKEAFLKATGEGLSYGLERCQVNVEGEAKIYQMEDSPYQQISWVAKRLELGPEYAACWVSSRKPTCENYYQLHEGILFDY